MSNTKLDLTPETLKSLSYYTLVKLSEVTGYANPVAVNVKGTLTVDDRGNFVKYEI